MNPPKDSFLKHAGIAFLAALAIYALFFAFDTRMRTRRGPWQVRFEATTNQEPLIVVNQPSLGIENVRILLSGEVATNTGAFQFDIPTKMNVPYGRVRFHDLTYLPGTVTLDVFGHEVEFLPRALFLNTKEVAWQNNTTFTLAPTNKIPGLKDRDRKGRR